jgi:hypothetical protein
MSLHSLSLAHLEVIEINRGDLTVEKILVCGKVRHAFVLRSRHGRAIPSGHRKKKTTAAVEKRRGEGERRRREERRLNVLLGPDRPCLSPHYTSILTRGGQCCAVARAYAAWGAKEKRKQERKRKTERNPVRFLL